MQRREQPQAYDTARGMDRPFTVFAIEHTSAYAWRGSLGSRESLILRSGTQLVKVHIDDNRILRGGYLSDFRVGDIVLVRGLPFHVREATLPRSALRRP